MNDPAPNLTTPQVLIRGYGVPMLFILTGVALGYYLSSQKKVSA